MGKNFIINGKIVKVIINISILCICYFRLSAIYVILFYLEPTSYIVVRGLFSLEEITKLGKFTETDEDIKKFSYGRDDGPGRIAKLCIWNYPGDDVTGVVAR